MASIRIQKNPDGVDISPVKFDRLFDIPVGVVNDFMQKNRQLDTFGYKVEKLRKAYLFLYNMIQFVGYMFIIVTLSVDYLRDYQDATHRTMELVGFVMRFCQTMQYLEIIHAIMGLTKTNVPVACLQVGGRALILFGIIQAEERLHSEPVVFWLFYFWSLADIIRYSFYMLKIYNIKNYFFTWLRYSAWIPLYLLGIGTECILIFQAIPYFIETGRHSVSLWIFNFSFPTIMRLYLLFGVLPVSYVLIRNMWHSRSKVLGKPRINIGNTKRN